jgi:hypothetical protein
VGLVDGVDYCAQTVAALRLATSPGGACASCLYPQPGACATRCPQCVNVLDFYIASCDGVEASIETSEFVTYVSLMNYTARLNGTSDCHSYFNLAAREYAAAECSLAFDHIATWSQSADGAEVVIVDGVMTTPYSCLLDGCPAACQADLDLMGATCHDEDNVLWTGNGLPAHHTSAGAPAGTFVSSADAWALFVNGSAPVPVNLAAGVSSATPLPLHLGACRLPVDATGRFVNYSPPPPGPPPPRPPPPGPPPPLPVRCSFSRLLCETPLTLRALCSRRCQRVPRHSARRCRHRCVRDTLLFRLVPCLTFVVLPCHSHRRSPARHS